MRIRALKALLLLVGFMGPGHSVTAGQTVNDYAVVPHKRMGAVAMGMTRAELIASRGTPERMEDGFADGASRVFYDSQQTAVYLDRKERVVSAWTTNPQYRSEGQVHVGSTESDLLRAHGSAKVVRHCNNINNYYTYFYQGISYQLSCGLNSNQSPAGQITLIWVEK